MGDVIIYTDAGWRVRLERYDRAGHGAQVAATVTDPQGNELHAGCSTASFSTEGAAAYLVIARELLPMILGRMEGDGNERS